MSIDEYCRDIQREYDTLRRLWFVLRCTAEFDIRPPQQAYLTGRVEWINGSKCCWTEFLDANAGRIEKLRYSYHVHDAQKRLVFRYDNALHKPTLPFREHKHCDELTIIAAPAPRLPDVLAECMNIYRWL
jgi:hypothetical protein